MIVMEDINGLLVFSVAYEASFKSSCTVLTKVRTLE